MAFVSVLDTALCRPCYREYAHPSPRPPDPLGGKVNPEPSPEPQRDAASSQLFRLLFIQVRGADKRGRENGRSKLEGNAERPGLQLEPLGHQLTPPTREEG